MKTRIPDAIWVEIIEKKQKGASIPALSREYGISENTIDSRLKREKKKSGQGATKKQQKAGRATLRQRRYANVLPFCKTKAEAKDKAGYSPNTDRVETPAVQELIAQSFAKAAEEEGLTLNLIARTLKGVMTSDTSRGQEKTQAAKTAGEMLGVTKPKEDEDDGKPIVVEIVDEEAKKWAT